MQRRGISWHSQVRLPLLCAAILPHHRVCQANPKLGCSLLYIPIHFLRFLCLRTATRVSTTIPFPMAAPPAGIFLSDIPPPDIYIQRYIEARVFNARATSFFADEEYHFISSFVALQFAVWFLSVFSSLYLRSPLATCVTAASTALYTVSALFDALTNSW